jgi:polysaccharide pyruvyl transferase WcaK-like protein
MTNLQKDKKIEHRCKGNNSKLSIKVGLISNSGFGNLGETATQQAIMQNIRRYCPDAVIHSFSPNPEDAEKELDIPSFPTTSESANGWWEGSGKNTVVANLNHLVNRLRAFPLPGLSKLPIGMIGSTLELLAWIRAYKYLKKFDLVIVSGGGQLDDYCMGGRWGYPFTLLMWGFLAKLCSVKYFIVSVGAGPLDFQKSRLFVRGALSLAQYRSYRDEDSKQYVREIVGFRENDPVYPDLAHSLQLEKYQELLDYPKSQQRENYRLIVGINPYICLIWNGSITELKPPYPSLKDGSLYLDYLDKLASFVSWLIQNQYGIRFLASETNEYWHDCRVVSRDIRNILDRNGVIYGENQIIEDSIQTLDDLMMQISLTDVVVASRFHCVLLSQLMNKPVLALSFHSKVDLLMADKGQADYCLPIDKFDVGTLEERFTALEANQESIKQQLAKRNQEYREALNEQYDRLFGSWQS